MNDKKIRHTACLILFPVIFAVFLCGCSGSDVAPVIPEVVDRTDEGTPATEVVTVSDLFSVKQSIGVVTAVSEGLEFECKDYPFGKYHVEIGQQVKKGDILASLDITELEKSITSLMEELESKSAGYEAEDKKSEYDIEIANIELQRMVNQLGNSTETQIKRLEIDLMHLEVEQRQERREIEKSNDNERLEKLTVKRDECVITAPKDGVVTHLNKNIDVNADGVFFVFITYDSEYYIENEINDSLNAQLLNYNLRRQDITANIGGNIYDLEYLPLTDSESELYEIRGVQQPVRYKIINPDEHIKIGMQALVNVHITHARDAVIIPLNAVYKSDTASDYVYVYSEGNLQVQPIKIGASTATSCEVKSGLYGGEMVVVK